MELTKLVSLLSKIDDAIDDSNYSEALQLLLINFSRFDDDALLRERVATILAERGRNKEAVEVWDKVARHWANAGYPARCLAAIKRMQALRPDAAVLLDHFTALYNIRSPYLDESVEPPQVPQPTDELEIDAGQPSQDPQGLLDAAYQYASKNQKLVDEPRDLPPLPLLSLLPADALRKVLDHVEYETFAAAESILERDKMNADLFWTVTSDFTVDNSDPKVRLPSGALLGLNAFGRSATSPDIDVYSQKNSELLRLPGEAIAALDDQLGDFRNRLATLRRHALTEGLLERHPMFDGLEPGERVSLIQAFTGLRVIEGERVIAQGTESPGIFMVLDGQVDVVRNDDDWEITIATLKAGDVFGEVGVVSDSPALAGCVMTTPGHLLFLSRDEFSNVADRYPVVAKYAANLASERMADVQSTLSAQDLAEVD